MRLLFVSPFVPGEQAGHGGGVAIGQFTVGLARLGHEVHLVSLCRQFEKPLLPQLRKELASVRVLEIPHRHDRSGFRKARHFLRLGCALLGGLFSRKPAYLLRYHYPAFTRLVVQTVAELQPDLVQLEFLQLAPLRQALPPGLPVVLDTLEVQSLAALRALTGAKRPLWFLHALELASWLELQARLEGFARVLTASETDRLALLACAPGLPVRTVAPGVDCRRYQPQTGPKQPQSLVFVGSYDHRPNLDAAALLLEVVWPQVLRQVPEVQLHLLGNHPPAALRARAGPQVFVPGFVEDLPRSVGTKSVFVAPLRQGAGIKVKLLEALALGLPVVTTAVGAEGIGLQHQKDAWIVQDAQGCAAACLRLLAEPELAETLGQAGRQLVLERFDAHQVARRLEQELLEVLAGAVLAHPPGPSISRLF